MKKVQKIKNKKWETNIEKFGTLWKFRLLRAQNRKYYLVLFHTTFS